MDWSWLFFWNNKTATDNDWHPIPGGNPIKYLDNSPQWLQGVDIEAATVDVAPLVVGFSGLAHLRQIHNFGLTAQGSPFRNTITMTALHRSVLFLTPLVLVCQAAGVDYRRFIPRWSHERERRRDEEEVRKHVDAGLGIGALSWVARIYVLNLGRAYWAPMDVLMGGALADLMHREYGKAHGW